jgi:neurotransmitter:Na+ symporter, NSS family
MYHESTSRSERSAPVRVILERPAFFAVSEVNRERWSSRFSFYLAVIGAAVGLGSVWRFPYLTGTNGGSVFILVFILALFVIAAPLLIAEYMIGRSSRSSPPQAAGAVAQRHGGSRAWNAIGQLGMWAALFIMSYYTVIAGWLLAYGWQCAIGELTTLSRPEVAPHFHAFLSRPIELAAWQLAFITGLAVISAFGLKRGVEVVTKIRAPGLLILLLILLVYTLVRGNVREGLAFAFIPHGDQLSARVVLTAVGQAFFATGVGMGMMLAYGAYIPEGTSLVRSSVIVCASILVVSLLATVIIFPLVFAYGLSPGQGPELVFDVLPIAFAEMPGGRMIGTLFFLLLLLSALTPSLAGLEPAIAWLQQSFGLARTRASVLTCFAIWIMGIPSVLSFNEWADWHPIRGIARFSAFTLFDALDFVCSNILLTVGALLTCLLVGWRLPKAYLWGELHRERKAVRGMIRIALRYVCPVAILAVLLAGLV